MHGLDAFFANVQLPSMSEVAHELIQTLNSENPDVFEVSQIISRDPALSGLYVLLHTSLSGVFNHAMVERVGADDFVPKYSQQELADRIRSRLSSLD